MRNKIKGLLSAICKVTLAIRGYRSYAIYKLLDWYCTVSNGAIDVFQEQIDAGIRAFEDRRNFRVASLKASADEAREWQLSTKNSSGIFNPVQLVNLRARAFVATDRFELLVLKTSTRSARAYVGTVGIALSLWRAESRSHLASYHSLSSIFRVDTPILEWELLLWLATNPMYAEEALGDLREGFESRKLKYGEHVARNYVRTQVFRDVRSRFGRITGGAALVTKLLHWLHQHPRK